MNNVTSGETQTYKKHYKFSIFLISALVVFGGVIVAVLLYLRSEGKLDAILEVLTKTFEEGGINSYLLLVWTLAIPLLLFILFLVNLKRRRKLRELQGGWQKAMKF